MIASAIGHSKASTTELYQHVNDALQHEGFAHLAALAPKHEPSPTATARWPTLST